MENLIPRRGLLDRDRVGAGGIYPSNVYIADLTQATFVPGRARAPGRQSGLRRFRRWRSRAWRPAQAVIAVAQGTHTGIVSGEFGGNAITAIALPTTSGSGMPAIGDWVTCAIDGFSNGFDPHTLTAYQSPNGGDAMAVLTNGGATSLAVVNLTKMLNTTIVPRTGNVCTDGTLPATVVSFIAVP